MSKERQVGSASGAGRRRLPHQQAHAPALISSMPYGLRRKRVTGKCDFLTSSQDSSSSPGTPRHYAYPISKIYQQECRGMAQKIQTLFIDDIDGGEAEGTVRFGLDGTDYEIDLSAKHDEELRTILGTYVAHARKIGGATRRPAGRGGRKPSTVDNVAVRTWARENG